METIVKAGLFTAAAIGGFFIGRKASKAFYTNNETNKVIVDSIRKGAREVFDNGRLYRSFEEEFNKVSAESADRNLNYQPTWFTFDEEGAMCAVRDGHFLENLAPGMYVAEDKSNGRRFIIRNDPDGIVVFAETIDKGLESTPLSYVAYDAAKVVFSKLAVDNAFEAFIDGTY
jgi:hypothetical protein